MHDFHELRDARSRLSFRNSLIQHLLRFKAGAKEVRTQLCISLAMVSVLLAASEWKNCLVL